MKKILVFIILILAIVGVASFFIFNQLSVDSELLKDSGNNTENKSANNTQILDSEVALDNNINNDLKLYRNEKFGISFQYSNSDGLILRTNRCGLTPGNPYNIELGLLSPKDLLIIENPGDFSIYINTVLWDDNLNLGDWIDRYVFSQKYSEILNKELTQFNNNQAISVNIKYPDMVGRDVYFSSNGRIYYFSLRTPEKGKDLVFEKFENILDTVAFTQPTVDLAGQWRTYKNSSFKINFPPSWHFYDEDRYPETTGVDITPVDFASYTSDISWPVLSIASTSDFGTNEEFASMATEGLKSVFPNATLALSKGSISGVSGLVGDFLTRRDDGSEDAEGKVFFVRDSRNQFMIVYLYQVDNRNLYKDEFEKIISTFEFIDSELDISCPEYLLN